MSYLTKKDVLASLKQRTLSHHGDEYTIFEAYLGTDPYSKRPVRKAAKSEARLRRKIEDFYRKLSAGGDAAVLLTAYESTDARQAIDLLKQAGRAMSLTECVRLVLADGGSFAPCSTTLAEAFDRYLASQEGKSEGHRKAVRSRVGTWVSLFGGERLLSEVTAKEVSENLESRLYDPKRAETKTTFNNHLSYIKTFLAWCAEPEQAYLRTNPLDGMRQKTKEWRQPEFVRAEDAARLFAYLWENRATRATDLANAVLSFFCGMRQEEILRVREGASAVTIDLAERFIRIVKVKGHLKGVKPRAFTIPDTAYAWMTAFPFADAISRTNGKFREHLVDAAKAAGIAVPRNAGRHTFITMYAAAYKNQVDLTKIAGNSEDVRSVSYDALVSEREGRAFFGILPSKETDDGRKGLLEAAPET